MWTRSTLEPFDAKARLIETEHVASKQHLKDGLSQQPNSLQRSLPNLLWLICGDMLAILSWCAMLLYALLLWYCHGKREVDLSDRIFDPHLLVELARPLSTIFTILFAATAGRFVRSFALWLLQRGCSIVTLDRLFGSTTVGGALVTNSTLGIPQTLPTYILVITLLCFWALSPLASQALLRIMSFQLDVEMRTLERTYMNISNWDGLQGAGSTGSAWVVAPNTLLNSALIAPQSTKDMPRDMWGNVKIPLLSALKNTETHGRWQEVKHNGFASYSSLVGLPIAMPIAGAPQTSGTSASISVASWYWDLDCGAQPWSDGSAYASDYNSTFDWQQSWTKQFTFNWTSTIYKGSSPIRVFVEDLGLNRTGVFCNAQCGNITTVFCPGLPARTFGMILDDSGFFVYGMCALKTIYVETEILCDHGGCRASRVRQLDEQGLPPPEWTILDICLETAQNWHPLGRFFTNLVDAIQSRVGGSGGQNALVGFINNPANAFGGGLTKSGLVDRPSDVITSRLALVLNSYWMSSLSYSLTTGDWGDNFEHFGRYAHSSLRPYANTSLLKTSTATVYDEYRLFTCNLWWLTVFTMSILVALVTSILGLCVILWSRGPRLAMNVTTMIRDSPYVVLPFDTSYMDDEERSKRMGQTRVVLADVAPGHEVGHIAIAQEYRGAELGQLKKGRLYD